MAYYYRELYMWCVLVRSSLRNFLLGYIPKEFFLFQIAQVHPFEDLKILANVKEVIMHSMNLTTKVVTNWWCLLELVFTLITWLAIFISSGIFIQLELETWKEPWLQFWDLMHWNCSSQGWSIWFLCRCRHGKWGSYYN